MRDHGDPKGLRLTEQLDLFADYEPRARLTAVAGPVADRCRRGRIGYLAGLAAEDMVARDYARRGMAELDRRWKGDGGEIDLICQNGDGLVFVEIKKSGSFDRAAARLTRRQMDRIYAAATQYLGTQPKGQLTEVRLDLALVDGQGAVRVVENAFWDA
jgi:putative endonuclease